jgi:mannosyltransferase
MRHLSHDLRKWIPVVTILLAFGLYLYRLDNQSFAFDEGWTSYAIHHSWRDMLSVLIPDNHPPLYYVLEKALAEAAGYTDFPMRYLSVIWGTVTVAGLYTLGRRLHGEVAGLASALLAAFLPSFVYYAQEARMYSLLMALGVLSSYSLLRALQEPAARRWRTIYVAAAVGALYTHYYAAMLLVAQNAAWVGWVGYAWLRGPRREASAQALRRLQAWVWAQAAILVLYLPWLPVLFYQVRVGQGTWWRMPLPVHVILKDMWRFFILGPNRPPSVPVLGTLLGPVAVALCAALFFGWRRCTWAWGFAWSTWLLPIALIAWIGNRMSLYTDRYALVALPGLAALGGLGVAACWDALAGRGRWIGRAAAGVLLAAALLGPLPQLRAYYDDPTYWREDFRRAAEYLMAQTGAGDTAILVGSAQPILHYYHGPATVLRFPQQGDSVQSEQEVVSLLRQSILPDHKVRMVMYSWQTVDPQSLVEGQLRLHCELRGEHWQEESGVRPIRIVNLANCDGAFALEPRQALDAVWDGQVALSAFHVPDLVPGKHAQIVLWWRTLRAPDQDYSVFVHLLDASGAKIAQYDKLPLNDFYPMRAWPVGVDQRDVYPLKVPADASLEGAYLAIGLYDHRTGTRLPVTYDGTPLGDMVRIPLTQGP